MLSNEKWFGASAGFYNGVATQSLRFNDGSSNYLARTPSSLGSRTTWTWSGWFKIGTSPTLYHSFFTGQTNYDQLRFDPNSNIIFAIYSGGSPIGSFTTTRKFRDMSGWYHIVAIWDTTNSTSGDRQRLYINGKRELNSNMTVNATPSLNATSNINNSGEKIAIGRRESTDSLYLDGYMAEINFLDGTAITHTQNSDGDYILDELGEVKNGVWIPKEYTGSYGTNGFRLEFKQTGDGESTASSSTIGADTSGNSNHFNDYNFDATDSNMPDSPENNFATYNVLTGHSSTTISQGNLRALANNSSNILESQSSTIGVTSGKWYAEFRADDLVNDGQNNGTQIGVTTVPFNRGSGNQNGYVVGNTRVNLDQSSGAYLGVDQDLTQNNIGTYADGDIIGVALNVDDSEVSFYKNGSAITNATDASITNVNGVYFFEIQIRKYDGDTSQITANFGQDSTFAGAVSAGGNTDGNGVGDFKYSVPSGYLALCSANLPDTTISPNQDTQADDHFNTVLYSGTGNTTQNITGVGFRPDWCWIKNRNTAVNHYLLDSSRGLNYLFANTINAEASSANRFNSFDSDGFQVEHSGGGNGFTNGSGQTYVAWNWKAGGTTPTKTYKVVVVSDSGNKYRFRNSADSATFAQSAVTLDLQEGGTYVFDWSDSTAQGHPIRFSTTSDGTHGGGSEYTTGVVKDDSAYKTTITVASSAPTLYYYCQNHSGMGGQVNTNTTHGSTNFDGSVLSISQINESAGFSIVTYTGSSNATVGHGLSQTPDFIIVKSRTETDPWVVYTSITGKDNYLSLNTTQASTSTSNYWGTGGVTSSVFGIYSNTGYANADGDLVAYCFHSVDGFSKIGSYTGNGSTDGTFVFTGFRPAFVLLKRTNGSYHWVLMDSVSDPTNAIDSALLPSGTNVAGTGYTVDFLSNGFKLRLTGTAMNASSAPHIYMAFAEQPFKFSNAR